MAWSPLKVSYFVLAPLSVLSGLVLILLFTLVKDLRRRPGWLILWQCIAQSLLDLHWLSSSEIMSHGDNAALCQVIGTVSVFAFLLTCNYTACLSYFIIVHLRRPLRSQSHYSMWSFHAVCHAIAAAIALALLADEDIGTSVMTTCFIKSETKAEVLLFVALAVYSPLCVGAGIYSVLKYRSHFILRKYIIKHTLVVVTFTTAWFFPALYHLMNEPAINSAKHAKTLGNVAIVMGAISGLITVLARLAEPGILSRLRRFLSKEPEQASSFVFSPHPESRLGSIEFTQKQSLTYADAVIHNTHQFAQSLLIGLYSVLAHYSDHDGLTTEYHFEVKTLHKDGELQMFTLANMPGFRCDIVEYAAPQFRLFRHADGLTEAVLARSLYPKDNWVQAGQVKGGKSGSLVLKTADDSVVLKTIKMEEMTTLLEKIVPQWDPNSDISVMSRIYGVFSIKIPGTSRVFFIAMNNISQVPRPLYALFDLKGSKFNRKVLKKPFQETLLVQTDTLKDLDFQEMIGKLSLSEADKDRLTFAVYSDVSTLSALQLMDYSLLIGIGDCPDPLDSLPKRLRRNLFACTNAPKRVYAIGLIDFLQSYSLSKRLERMGKRLVAAEEDISSADADVYSERFLDMVGSITE